MSDTNQHSAGGGETNLGLAIFFVLLMVYCIPEYQKQNADLLVRQQGLKEAQAAVGDKVLTESIPASTTMTNAVFGETMAPTSAEDEARVLVSRIKDIRALGSQLNQEVQQIKALEGRLQQARSQEEAQRLVQDYQQKVRELESGRAIYQARVDQSVEPLKLLAARADVSRDVKMAYAFVLGEKGDYASKIRIMEEQQSAKPLDLAESLDLVFTYEQMNRLSEAVHTLERVLKLPELSAEETSQIKAMLAQQYFWTEKFDEAIAIYDDLAKEGRWASLIAQPKQNASEARSLYQQELEYRKQAAADLPKAEIKTSKGLVTVELFEDDAPNAVANFIVLAEQGFYNGQKFHRVIPKFMAQGGDPNSKDEDPANDGSGGPGYTIKTEISRRNHMRGSLSYANAGINTDGSQFFLTVVPTFWLNGRHAVFGRVLDGLPVVDSLTVGDQIEQVRILNKRNKEYSVVKN